MFCHGFKLIIATKYSCTSYTPAAAMAANPKSPGDKSENSLVTSIVPDAPIGCPLARAPLLDLF